MRIFLIFILLLILYSCNNNPTGTGGSSGTDPISLNILQTDETGRILGGDFTDWCGETNGYKFPPVYPNPVKDTFYVSWTIPSSVDARIYFRDSLGVEKEILDTVLQHPGNYQLRLRKSDVGYSNKVIKLYMNVNNFSFFCAGDVQFY